MAGKTYIEKRSHRWPLQECPDCRNVVGATLDGHMRHVTQKHLAEAGLPLIADWTPKRGAFVLAVVNHGRWIVECPTPQCGGAEQVDPDWPVYVCAGGDGCGVGPLTVAFPEGWQEVETELLARPAAATRNFLPHETVADLRRENEMHAAEIGAL